MFFGETVDIQSHDCIRKDAIQQQTVVYIDAQVLAGKIGAEFNVVSSFVGDFFVVGINILSKMILCQISELIIGS